MWTPRRLMLVMMGLVLFTGGFTLYASLFGWIDGLPPLPERYTCEQSEGAETPEVNRAIPPLLTRLRTAFGPNCIEQSYKLKFESREKGLVFAASDSKILPDGRMQLDQPSIAVFGKNNHELTTIHSDRAFLTFDQPVRKIDDMSTRKITAAELHADAEYPTSDERKGKVHIINNRKTINPDDDLIMKTPGPLYYVDEPKPAQPHIWTYQAVEMVDRQNRPLPSQSESSLFLPTVTAEGMRVYLVPASTVRAPAPAAAPVAATKAGSKKEPKLLASVNGCDHIELDRHVFMNLWTESSGMAGPGTAKKQPANPPDAKPEDRVLITIQTNGPFAYDMIKDIAHFEVPPKSDPGIQEYVKLTRHAKGNMEDTLTSDFLDVQFHRRQPAPDGAAPAVSAPSPPVPPKTTPGASEEKLTNPDNDLEIETLHAWGKSIALSSDLESLFAFGHDLFYDARIKQTILKGAPMHAVKNGNLIRAPELLMANLNDATKQSARARGPGVVGMGDFDPKTQEHSRQAFFQDSLVVAKVTEQGKDLDLIILTGKARFIDTLNDQRISARQLKLWMLGAEAPADAKQVGNTTPGETGTKPRTKLSARPSGPAKKTEPETKPKGEGKRLPHRLEAVGDVVVSSPDLEVNKSDYLNTWFKDVPPPAKPAPLDSGAPPVAVGTAADPKAPPPAKKDSAEKKGPPLIVRHARRIEAWVNRVDGVNVLDKVHNEGNVIIHQDPTPDNETGVDIAGHTVDLEHFVEGDYLTIEGNEQSLGEFHVKDITINADDIRIDQRDNTATVKGQGNMRLLSKTTLDGGELEKPSYIDIFWNDAMELEGPINSVRYEGSVTAKQNESKVLCETMQVWLDRPVYLNQATKPKKKAPVKKAKKDNNTAVKSRPKTPAKKDAGDDDDDSPKVERVFCDQVPSFQNKVRPKRLLQVSAEEMKRVDGKIEYKLVHGTQIKMDNVQNRMETRGPGTVRIWQPGSSDSTGGPPAKKDKDNPNAKKVKGNANANKDNANAKKAKGKKDDDEMKLTWVSFDDLMIANSVARNAVFRRNVEMVHMPSDRPDVPINIARLPEKALYLRCDEKLEMATQSRKALDEDGKEVEVKWQEMKATGNVWVKNEDFDARANIVTYSEEKTLLVFYGTISNPAVMKKSEIKGGPKKTFLAKTITYNVKTKDFTTDETVGGGN